MTEKIAQHIDVNVLRRFDADTAGKLDAHTCRRPPIGCRGYRDRYDCSSPGHASFRIADNVNKAKLLQTPLPQIEALQIQPLPIGISLHRAATRHACFHMFEPNTLLIAQISCVHPASIASYKHAQQKWLVERLRMIRIATITLWH